MLSLDHIRVQYGSLTALHDFSAEIPQGQITILAGPDGAGKSSLMRMIIGLAPKSGGRLTWQGAEIVNDHRPLTSQVGYMPERFSLYPDLTVKENLQFFGRIHGLKESEINERSHDMLSRTGMLPFQKRRAGRLSGGMKQKLALSTILLAAPQLIILDEPTTGVDPLSRIEFFSIIENLRSDGKTILLATPYLDEAERGDRVIFIKEGRKLTEGRIEELKIQFTPRLWDITPRRTGFDLLREMSHDEYFQPRLYQRGNVIKYLQTDPEKGPAKIPSQSYQECSPTLEDIYLYQDRLMGKEVQK